MKNFQADPVLALDSQQRVLFLALLRDRFPWLGTDEEAHGGDTVDALNALYETLGGEQ